MIAISKNLRDLSDEIVGLRTHCNHNDYPTEYQTFDEAWENLAQSLDHLKGKLGDGRHAQLVEMAAQARAHYKADEIKLGSWLMQDMGQVVRGKEPFAYPVEMYRWPRDIAE